MVLEATIFFDKITGELCSTRIAAKEIKSLESARNYGFFVNDDLELVYWVGMSKVKANGLSNRSHFKRYGKIKKIKTHTALRSKNNSEKHKKAISCVVSALKYNIKINRPVKWTFLNKKISEYPFSGNLIRCACSVEDEYFYSYKYGKYIFDVAIIGPSISGKETILGAIEIVNKSMFDLDKMIACKSLGFPLVSIDISELDEQYISESWATDILEQTTSNSSRRRFNYVYLHHFLMPVFCSAPLSNAEKKTSIYYFC
jgi:hypothetical protein